MRISHSLGSVAAYEYGCDLRRLYPWEGIETPPWGSAIASVRPGEATTPHAHDEEETFIILSGRGAMTIGDETEPLGPQDVVYIERNKPHTIRNMSASEPLVFLTIFWGLRTPDEGQLAIET